MARPPETLPEGTDAIIPGASAEDEADTDFIGDQDTGGTTPVVEGEAGDGWALGHGQKFEPIPLGDLDSSEGGKSSGGAPDAGLKETAQRVVGERAAGLRDQAAEKARSFATQGKDRATEALDNVIRMVEEAASTVDDKVGEQYGDYVRRAGDALAGISTQLREKDVDDLIADARDVVRKNPAVAIGAAAAIGFLIARVAKVGVAPAEAAAPGGTATESEEA